MNTWYAAKASGDQGLVIDEQTGENIAAVYKAENAALIAAAPELRTSLTAMVEHCTYMNNMQHAGQAMLPIDWSTLYDLQNKARAALAKVE